MPQPLRTGGLEGGHEGAELSPGDTPPALPPTPSPQLDVGDASDHSSSPRSAHVDLVDEGRYWAPSPALSLSLGTGARAVSGDAGTEELRSRLAAMLRDPQLRRAVARANDAEAAEARRHRLAHAAAVRAYGGPELAAFVHGLEAEAESDGRWAPYASPRVRPTSPVAGDRGAFPVPATAPVPSSPRATAMRWKRASREAFGEGTRPGTASSLPPQSPTTVMPRPASHQGHRRRGRGAPSAGRLRPSSQRGAHASRSLGRVARAASAPRVAAHSLDRSRSGGRAPSPVSAVGRAMPPAPAAVGQTKAARSGSAPRPRWRHPDVPQRDVESAAEVEEAVIAAHSLLGPAAVEAMADRWPENDPTLLAGALRRGGLGPVPAHPRAPLGPSSLRVPPQVRGRHRGPSARGRRQRGRMPGPRSPVKHGGSGGIALRPSETILSQSGHGLPPSPRSRQVQGPAIVE